MRQLAALASVLVLLAYVALMGADPSWGWFRPRGGLLMLALSLLIANAGIWLSLQAHRPLGTRFQFAAAGWIWLLVQGGSIGYLYALT